MARKWNDLKGKMGPAARGRAERKTASLLAALTLADLLRDRGVTQTTIARKLGTAQGNVSRLLRRPDMHLSTLRQLVHALGGSLELSAKFADREYRIVG
ncbi:MAG TPA: XRE family transcriptional regulator [Gemmatimonadales bacterium]|nr:XRE family transcriptional regulator [Gemmatimonadales bacterium]